MDQVDAKKSADEALAALKFKAQRGLDNLQWCGKCPKAGHIYRNAKGGLYWVVAVSVKEDTLEILVTYFSNAKRTYWTRTLDNFLERFHRVTE